MSGVASMSSSRRPYVGPRAFTVGEVLHGRDREVADLCDLVIAERVVLLYSPSGAGKSSLLAAGLLPQLRAEGFAVRPPARVGHELPDMQAGVNRFVLSVLLSLEEDVAADAQLSLAALGTTTLAAYLERRRRDDGVDVDVIIIDQFEEVLTADPSAHAARLEFFAQLGAALRDTRRYAVLAMREDWVAALDPYRGAVPTRLRTRFRLDLLGPEGARAAVQAPARAAGVEFSDAAARKLVDDLRQIKVQRPDGTIEMRTGPHVEPVQLQVVCLDLWARRGDAMTIDVASLGAVGDVDHALADYYAAQALQIASTRQVPERVLRAWVARHLITEQGLREQVLRTPGSTQGLADAALQDLVDAHLLRAEARRGALWLELAHDRLVAPILASNAGWALAHTEPAQRQAALWDVQGRPEHLLLLDEAGLERAARLPEMMYTPVEREFITQSRWMMRRKARERRNVRFIRVLAVCALLGLMTASVFAARSQQAAKAAEEARKDAIAAMLVAQDAGDSLRKEALVTLSRHLAAQSQLLPRTESDRAALLAVASSKLAPSEARATLISLLERWPRLAGGLGRSTPVYDIAVAEPSGVMISNGRDQGLAGWDLEKRARLWQHARLFTRSAPAVAPRGDVVAVALATGQLAVQRVATGEDVARIDLTLPIEDGAVAVAFAPDGETLVVGSRAGTVLAVSRAGAPLWRRERAMAEISAIAWDDDGVLVVDAVGVHRLARGDGARMASIAASGPVQAVAVAPGRPWAALALADGSRVEFFDLSLGTRRALALGSAVTVPALAIGPRGAVAAVRCQAGCVSAEAVVWAAGEASPHLVVPLPMLAPTALGFDLTEERLVVGTAVEPPLLFDVVPLPGLPAGVEAAAFSADGMRLAVAGARAGPELWTIEPRRSHQVVGRVDATRSLRFVGGDARLAVVDASGEVAVWDVQKRKVLQRQRPPTPGIATEIAETAAGALLAATTLVDGRVVVWDASTGAQVHALQASEAWPADAAWGPNGLLVTAACGLGDARCSWTAPRMWRTAAAQPDGATLTVAQGRVDLLTVAPDGRSLVARNGSGLERWDLATGDVIERPLDAGAMVDLVHAPAGDVLVAAGAAVTACASGLCTHGRLRLFDAATLEPVGAPMLNHLAGGSMRLLAVSPGDLRLVVQSGPETALWSLDVATLRRRVCALAGREPTPAEWQQDLERWGPQRPVCADMDAWPDALGGDAP